MILDSRDFYGNGNRSPFNGSKSPQPKPMTPKQLRLPTLPSPNFGPPGTNVQLRSMKFNSWVDASIVEKKSNGKYTLSLGSGRVLSNIPSDRIRKAPLSPSVTARTPGSTTNGGPPSLERMNSVQDFQSWRHKLVPGVIVSAVKDSPKAYFVVGDTALVSKMSDTKIWLRWQRTNKHAWLKISSCYKYVRYKDEESESESSSSGTGTSSSGTNSETGTESDSEMEQVFLPPPPVQSATRQSRSLLKVSSNGNSLERGWNGARKSVLQLPSLEANESRNISLPTRTTVMKLKETAAWSSNGNIT